MNTCLKNKKQSVTFRQWSGKNYAIYASIGKEINIGHVDIDTCDQSLLKDKECNFLNLTNIDKNLKPENEEIDDLQDLNVDQFISLLSIVKNTDISSGQSPYSKINSAINFIQSFRISEYLFPHFIIYWINKFQILSLMSKFSYFIALNKTHLFFNKYSEISLLKSVINLT